MPPKSQIVNVRPAESNSAGRFSLSFFYLSYCGGV
nr:MAG TPA: hypothetical protein [Caudoviricetes sp.]